MPRHKSKQNPVADMYSTGMLERIASKVGWRNICTLGYAQSFEKLGRTCEELQQGKSKARLIRALGQQEDNFEGGFRNACNTTDASASPAFLFVPSKSRVGEGRDARYERPLCSTAHRTQSADGSVHARFAQMKLCQWIVHLTATTYARPIPRSVRNFAGTIYFY